MTIRNKEIIFEKKCFVTRIKFIKSYDRLFIFNHIK